MTNLNQFTLSISPAEAASTLLTQHKGNQRSAKVMAWKASELYGSMNKRNNEYDWWIQVIRHIVFGGEYPVVARQSSLGGSGQK